jgi:four helix bundle protein
MGHSYRDLVVWQKALAMAIAVCKVAQRFPKTELYGGLISQIERSAVSVPSNIAEGQGRLTKNDFRHFLGQARGSLLEMETQLLIAHGLSYLDQRTLDELMNSSGEVSRMLHALIQSMSPKPVEADPSARN